MCAQNKQRNVICLTCYCNQKTFPSFYLAVAANWERAAFTAVCKQVVIALCTVLCVLFHYVLFPQQGIFAVMTVEMFGARHFASDLFGWRSKVKKMDRKTSRKDEGKKCLANFLAMSSTSFQLLQKRNQKCIKANSTLFDSGKGWGLNWQSKWGWEGVRQD